MAVLAPRLAILDETDSGLDIDALRVVADGVNSLRRPDNATIVVTHYQRLLNYIVPDYVHVLAGGRIVRSGGKELAVELEARGYDWLTRARDRGSVSGGSRRTSTTSPGSPRDAAGRADVGCSPIRRAAFERFRALGFPTRRDEDWHFTSVAPIADAEFTPLRGDGIARGR